MWPEENSSPDASMKENTTKRKHSKYSETELEKLKKETHRSQAQTQNFKAASDDVGASFEGKGSYSDKNLRDFLARFREDTKIKSERCNKDQKDIIGKVVQQIIEDSNFQLDRRRRRPQQFIRLLHGGPGTGKKLRH